MTPIAWLTARPEAEVARAVIAQAVTDGRPDLLRISLVVALVVVSVIALSYALRPLLPPARPPLTEAEVDERTLRSLGLHGEPERPGVLRPSRQADVIPFPRGPRDPILDEDERLYRDPVVAARLRAVLEPSRRRAGRSSAASPLGPVVLPTAGPPAPTPRPSRPGEHDRRRVRHTVRAPSAGGERAGLGRDQELPPMRPPDMETAPGDSPYGLPGGLTASGERPSDAARSGRGPEPIVGSPPSDADLERLAADRPQPRAKVVPFIPRQAARESAPDQEAVDPAVVAALTATVRELLFCANVGELLHGFALYSDLHLFRFMDETGLTVDEFRVAFEGAAPREADDWTRLSHLGEVHRLADGRVAAVVTYLDGERPGGSERYTFEYEPSRGLWLIDDIAQV